ncbi:MAG: hypothetical protein ACRES4_08430, partial [Nevskiales bacterium]
VTGTILIPLRGAIRKSSAPLALWGSAYFSLIGIGFMLAEISILQYFSVYLGHPTYSLAVCLFSLILATGIGSLASGRFEIRTPVAMMAWGLLAGGYLMAAQHSLTGIFEITAAYDLPMRISVSLLVVMPLGFILGFAFPTGIRMVGAVDSGPTPWFWGINGATGVLASVLAIIISMSFGINVTMLVSAICYLALIPVAIALMRLGGRGAEMAGASHSDAV